MYNLLAISNFFDDFIDTFKSYNVLKKFLYSPNMDFNKLKPYILNNLDAQERLAPWIGIIFKYDKRERGEIFYQAYQVRGDETTVLVTNKTIITNTVVTSPESTLSTTSTTSNTISTTALSGNTSAISTTITSTIRTSTSLSTTLTTKNTITSKYPKTLVPIYHCQNISGGLQFNIVSNDIYTLTALENELLYHYNGVKSFECPIPLLTSYTAFANNIVTNELTKYESTEFGELCSLGVSCTLNYPLLLKGSNLTLIKQITLIIKKQLENVILYENTIT